MGKRRKSSDDGLGCLFAVIQLIGSVLILLFSSGDPTAKKVGWGIVGSLLVFYVMSSVGASSEEILAVLGILFVVVICVLICMGMSSNKTTTKVNGSAVEKQKEQKEAPVATTMISENRAEESKVVSTQSFEEQLEMMKRHAGMSAHVSCDSENEKNENINVVNEKKLNYYHSVQEALDIYYVPSIYKKIMIHEMEGTEIKRCPGLAWVDDKMLYVLALVTGSKIYRWPLSSITMVSYEKLCDIDVESFYEEMYSEEIGAEFEDLLPQCLFDGDGTYTGIFALPVGLKVTNTSGKVLMDLLQTEFHVVDEVTQSMQYVKEVKEIYEWYILKENGVISYEEYAKKREELLKEYREREKNEVRYEVQMKEARKLYLV